MMSTVRLSCKGQVVIPAKIRRKSNLKPQSKVSILDLDDQIVLFPLPDDPIRAADGILESEKSVLEMMREARRNDHE